MRYEPLIRALKRFDAEHSFWDYTTCSSPTNQTLRREIGYILQNQLNLESFLIYSTPKDLEDLLKEVRDFVPRFTVATLKGILDELYKCEALQQSFNKELVRWYRAQGWSFPEFTFEQSEKIESETISQPSQPILQEPTCQDATPQTDGLAGEAQAQVSGAPS
jgi:hypothetical protein